MPEPSLHLLTVNRHTGYLYNLSKIGHQWSFLGDWKTENRPQPSNFHRIEWKEARRAFATFDAVIGHDIRLDLAKFLPYCLWRRKPYLQVLHGRRSRGGFSRNRGRGYLKQLYSRSILGPSVALGWVKIIFISAYAGSDWGLDGTVIDPGIDLGELTPYAGTDPSLLVVGNMLHREHFAFRELEQIRRQVPVKIVGKNTEIATREAQNWEELRSYYSQCRAYLNLTREPEDGHNLALLEAMGSGMPVIALDHCSTPIRNGENGFLVAGVPEAVERAKQLLADPELARRMGQCARETVARRFSPGVFQARWNDLLRRSIRSSPELPAYSQQSQSK